MVDWLRNRLVTHFELFRVQDIPLKNGDQKARTSRKGIISYRAQRMVGKMALLVKVFAVQA